MKISIIVLLYNHERYIQECLESIKYQTENYNCNKAHTVQVIIADDASSDGSKKAVEDWSSRNPDIFETFEYIDRTENVGTCSNYLGALKKAEGDYIKVIGGDDLFPQMSIFEIFSHLDTGADIVTGYPLVYFENGTNNINDALCSIHRNQCITLAESKLTYDDKIHRYCFFNAPATYISKQLLTDERVLFFLSSYKYIDDYTQWLKFSEIKDINVKYLNAVTIIYRRTNHSTYMIRNQELFEERIRIYMYAFSKTKNILNKALLKNSIINIKAQRRHNYLNLLSYLHIYHRLKYRRKIQPIPREDITENFALLESLREKAATTITTHI